jgi:phospholipid/cholesterol/gamma-HCH transport system substrate-binding protein
MNRVKLETAVGVFTLVGLACAAGLAAQLGRAEPLFQRGYELTATFSNAGGLKRGAAVELAGVEIGRVVSIGLERYRAVVTLRLRPDMKLQDDAIVSIRTRGLIGEKFVAVTPGGSEQLVAPGSRLRETEDPIDLEQLIASYIMGKV